MRNRHRCADIEQNMKNGGPCHAELGRYVPDHRPDRRHFGLRRNRRGLDRNRQGHLLYRGGVVPGLRRGRSGAGPNPDLKAERYFEGIATFLPMPSGRGTVLWAFANIWMRVRTLDGNGAVFRAVMSM